MSLVAAAIIWFHRANIQRLLAGTENRFGRRAADRTVSASRCSAPAAGARRSPTCSRARARTVRLWAYEPEVVEAINRDAREPAVPARTRRSRRHCARRRCDARRCSGAERDRLGGAEPRGPRRCSRRVPDAVPPGHAGRERHQGHRDGHARAHVATCSPSVLPQARFAVLSGPSFANEVYEGQPTAVVAAARSIQRRREAVQQLFATPRFRVYTKRDVVGVELGGRAQERDRDRRRHPRGARARAQSARGADHARAGRDHPARRRAWAPTRSPSRASPAWATWCSRPPASLSRNRALGVALAQGETLEEYRARAPQRGRGRQHLARRRGARHAHGRRAADHRQKVARSCSSGKSPREAMPRADGTRTQGGAMAMTTTRPVQEFYSIGEVCALTDLKPHVLRYWESQFRFLNPAKNRSGNRVYKSARGRADHAGEAPALHREVHHRRRPPADRPVPPDGRARGPRPRDAPLEARDWWREPSAPATASERASTHPRRADSRPARVG